MKIPNIQRTFKGIVNDVPQLKRGRVWCLTCGHTERVDSAVCLAKGWPMHCGETMSIDSPEERERRAVAEAAR